jgi:hypothetical protein
MPSIQLLKNQPLRAKDVSDKATRHQGDTHGAGGETLDRRCPGRHRHGGHHRGGRLPQSR